MTHHTSFIRHEEIFDALLHFPCHFRLDGPIRRCGPLRLVELLVVIAIISILILLSVAGRQRRQGGSQARQLHE